MKINLTVIISFFACIQLYGQNLVASEKFKISFETTEVLENYQTESDSVLGYDNINYAIDIEVVPFAYESAKFIQDQKYGAREIAEDMGFNNIVDGGNIPNIEFAFYVITEEKEENLLIPVFIVAMLNNDLQIAYEITVYCYNLNKDEGEKIVKSFKLIN